MSTPEQMRGLMTLLEGVEKNDIKSDLSDLYDFFLDQKESEESEEQLDEINWKKAAAGAAAAGALGAGAMGAGDAKAQGVGDWINLAKNVSSAVQQVSGAGQDSAPEAPQAQQAQQSPQDMTGKVYIQTHGKFDSYEQAANKKKATTHEPNVVIYQAPSGEFYVISYITTNDGMTLQRKRNSNEKLSVFPIEKLNTGIKLANQTKSNADNKARADYQSSPEYKENLKAQQAEKEKEKAEKEKFAANIKVGADLMDLTNIDTHAGSCQRILHKMVVSNDPSISSADRDRANDIMVKINRAYMKDSPQAQQSYMKGQSKTSNIMNMLPSDHPALKQAQSACLQYIK